MQSNELMTIPNSTLNKGMPTEHEMNVLQAIATQAVESKFYKHIGDKSGVLMVMLAARELDIPPMLALNGGMNMIQGKIEVSARLMNALMRRAGISITVKESTDTKCVLAGVRKDSGDNIVVSYSIEDAQKAGLIKTGGGWVKNPKDMLFARAVSRLARQIAPDIIGGCYIEGEIRTPDRPPEVSHEPINAEIIEVVNVDTFLSQFDEDMREDFKAYMKTVESHFKWSEEQTIQEFSKHTKTELMEKYNRWKNKKTAAVC